MSLSQSRKHGMATAGPSSTEPAGRVPESVAGATEATPDADVGAEARGIEGVDGATEEEVAAAAEGKEAVACALEVVHEAEVAEEAHGPKEGGDEGVERDAGAAKANEGEDAEVPGGNMVTTRSWVPAALSEETELLVVPWAEPAETEPVAVSSADTGSTASSAGSCTWVSAGSATESTLRSWSNRSGTGWAEYRRPVLRSETVLARSRRPRARSALRASPMPALRPRPRSVPMWEKTASFSSRRPLSSWPLRGARGAAGPRKPSLETSRTAQRKARRSFAEEATAAAAARAAESHCCSRSIGSATSPGAQMA